MKEIVHGLVIEDPYRDLESDTEQTRRWIEQQNRYTEQHLLESRDQRAQSRLRDLLTIGEIGDVALAGNSVFYCKREGEREQLALFMAKREAEKKGLIVDPLDFGETAALDWMVPSPNGRFLAFGVSFRGDERSTLHILDIPGSTLLEERIEHTKWCALSWLRDETGFYYTRYPQPGESNFNPNHQDSYNKSLFFHRLGDQPLRDQRIWESPCKTDSPWPYVSDDNRFLVINNFHSWSSSGVYLMSLKSNPQKPEAITRLNSSVEVINNGIDCITIGRVIHGTLYLLTNREAPRFRILKYNLDTISRESYPREVIPQSSTTIEDFVVTQQYIAVHYIDQIHSKLKIFDLQGAFHQEVILPCIGTLSQLSTETNSNILVFTFSSFFHPPSLMEYNIEQGSLSQIDQVHFQFDSSRYSQSRKWVKSLDGTLINIYFIHQKELRFNMNNPVLIYGYGGFGVSLLPKFIPTALYFLERGGVYALANLRGGSEFGQTWHSAGMLKNKHKVFEDFEAVIDFFSHSAISRPEKTAITGGSNGGLLVGAMITRIPERFQAAVSYVGLYDMLRYHKFPPAALWISEYGDPDDPATAKYLLSYSPYHNLREGTHYPATLIETADSDTRVYFGHSTKFAARLQQATASKRPVYFYMERDAGHGRGTRLSLLLQRYQRMYAFIELQLGMHHPPKR